MLRVAYQGMPGAYSEEAIGVFWEGTGVAVPMQAFGDVVAAVWNGSVEAGVIPVENSRTGVIDASRDALLDRPDLVVLLETGISVRHQLLAIPGASFDSLRRVASHSAALAQCRDWLARHRHLEPVVVSDTAGAARDVARTNDYTLAAIASAAAGVRYGLSALARDLQDDPMNHTRFWAVARASVAAQVRTSGHGGRAMHGITVASAIDQLRVERAERSRAVEVRGDRAGAPMARVPSTCGEGGSSHGLA